MRAAKQPKNTHCLFRGKGQLVLDICNISNTNLTSSVIEVDLVIAVVLTSRANFLFSWMIL